MAEGRSPGTGGTRLIGLRKMGKRVIKMEEKKKAVVLGLVVASLLPILSDPFFHEEKVNFWVWLTREFEEILTGEKE